MAAAEPSAAVSDTVSLRVQDIGHETFTSPIPGLRKILLVPFIAGLRAAAVSDAELDSHMPELEDSERYSDVFASNVLAQASRDGIIEPLEREEIKAVYMYTCNTPFFRILNARLRTEDRAVLEPFLPLLKLLLTAVYKLSTFSGMLFRGIKEDSRDMFAAGDLKVWWAFSSTTSDISVLANAAFAGYKGQRTFFYIHASTAFDVARYTAFPKERELLLPPGSTLEVGGLFSPAPDIHNITLYQRRFIPLRLQDQPSLPSPAAADASRGDDHDDEQDRDHSADDDDDDNGDFVAVSRSTLAAAGPGTGAPSLKGLAIVDEPSVFDTPHLSLPTDIHEFLDGSVAVANNAKGFASWRVWLDRSQPPQQLPPATACASAVVPLADGFLIVDYWTNRVERIGIPAWKRCNLTKPWSAAIVGDTAAVTECHAGQVVRLDLRSGMTIDVFGKRMLREPYGICTSAAGTGEYFVCDGGTHLVHVFDRLLTQTRTLGAGLLRSLWGVSTDSSGRVFVADRIARAVVVLDAAGGQLLSTVCVHGKPRGVTVTRAGTLVVSRGSLFKGKGIVWWG